jgi:hypothetical protein
LVFCCYINHVFNCFKCFIDVKKSSQVIRALSAYTPQRAELNGRMGGQRASVNVGRPGVEVAEVYRGTRCTPCVVNHQTWLVVSNMTFIFQKYIGNVILH